MISPNIEFLAFSKTPWLAVMEEQKKKILRDIEIDFHISQTG
jgi:hypothetical protein